MCAEIPHNEVTQRACAWISTCTVPRELFRDAHDVKLSHVLLLFSSQETMVRVPLSRRRKRTFMGLLLFFSVLIPYEMDIFRSSSQRPTTCVEQRKNAFWCALSDRADRDNFVFILAVDKPVVDMAINLYEFSFRPYNIENFLFVGFDEESCSVLHTSALPCFHLMGHRSDLSSQPSTYQTKEFLKKMDARNHIIMQTLTNGFNVILMDLDIAFLKNPLNDMKVINGTRLLSHNFLAAQRFPLFSV